MDTPFGFDGVIMENGSLHPGNWGKQPLGEWFPVGIPEGVKPASSASLEAYQGYRCVYDGACADLVVVTRTKDGNPAALLAERGPNAPWPGVWWMFGGAIAAYRRPDEWIVERVKQECGLTVNPEVLLGVYRTCAPRKGGKVASTMQLCYASYVPIDKIAGARVDRAHTSLKLFTEPTLKGLLQKGDPSAHWYPVRAACLAMRCMP